MKMLFFKYHALGNSFLVVESGPSRRTRTELSRLARTICDPQRGIGADGVLHLSAHKGVDRRVDVYNADGSWAERSGNGLRIAALYLAMRAPTKRQFTFHMGGERCVAELTNRISGGQLVRADLGKPDFVARNVPMRADRKYVINSPIKVGGTRLDLTCLSVGNPHCVLFVDGFDFDWKKLGRELETASIFPKGTNVEFVRPISRRKLQVRDWERGVGATGSSGTGAAAATCAAVMLGLAERNCEVQFESGSLRVYWRQDTGSIELSGPVQFIAQGEFQLPPKL
ncbi:MAG: diaminopimelate epimerase [Candidatus Zixiibacteriota bacterium]